jgi:hypothetical protein
MNRAEYAEHQLAEARAELDRTNGLLAECHEVLGSIVVGRAMVAHLSERPEWFEQMMPIVRAVLAKLESRGIKGEVDHATRT